MANKTLFKSSKTSPQVKVNPKGWVPTVNDAGGSAFSFPDKLALAQFAVTGTFNNVFYTDAESQLEKVKQLALKVDSLFLAKLAVYAHESAFMKDVPAFLLAVLHARGETALLEQVFSRVVSNAKMLANFVQIVRSGVTGRKSFGTATKRVIQHWLEGKNAKYLFNGSIGLANPSVADIVKMVHPKADSAEKDAIYAYLTEARGYEAKLDNLPLDVQLFEQLKKGETTVVPDVPFRALTNCNLTSEQWKSIARAMPFNTLRQNLNMLSRKDLFNDGDFVAELAAKLRDPQNVRGTKVFPYQLFVTYMNTEGLPSVITEALQDAAELATDNVPSFGGRVVMAVDVSGSMSSAITGNRPGVPASKVRCVDVAGLMASCVLRQNKDARLIMFDTTVHETRFNPRDSIMTNAQKIAAFGGGGTNLDLPVAKLNAEGYKADLVIYFSDNCSWAGNQYGTAAHWVQFKRHNPKAKLVNLDIQPYANAQVPDNKDVLNIGGFSDIVWETISRFVKGGEGNDFVTAIENSVEL